MRIFIYDLRDDEREYAIETAKQLHVDIEWTAEKLTLDTVDLSRGFQAVSILGHSTVDQAVLQRLKANHINFLSTRTIGYNHIDVQAAKQLGIQVANSEYAPNGVAEFTVMLMLMSIRKYKQALFRGNVNDYSLVGLQGQEMKDLTVGILGSGKIGSTVVNCLSGFGCNILVYDPYPNQMLKQKATFVDLDTLYAKSDVISLHLPLLADTYHMINDEAIARMKPGVVLINCARGGLVDIGALIKGIETKKIGALGLDVIENEEGIYHQDRRTDILRNREMAYLRQFPNVTMTQHMAFYTDAAVRSMVVTSLESLVSFMQTGDCKYTLR